MAFTFAPGSKEEKMLNLGYVKKTMSVPGGRIQYMAKISGVKIHENMQRKEQ